MSRHRIGLINDIHYGFPADREQDWIEPGIEDLIERFNDADLDVVIALGDMIEHGTAEEDSERLGRLRELFDRLDAPVHAIPGNHDVINMDAGTYVDRLGAANDEPFFSIDTGDTRVIGLDTTHRDPDLHPVAGRLGQDQRAWLDGELETEQDVYLLSHHLLHFRDLEGNFYFDDKPELAIAVDKRSVTKMIEEHGSVQAVVSAHIHEEGLARFHGVPHMTLGAMDKTAPEEGYEPPSAILSAGTDGFELEAADSRYEDTF
jgi:3',5'-cyclic AMP phosphodiesterase CpdA